MGSIRFTGIGRTNSQFAEIIFGHTGWKARRSGEDWVVPADDPALVAGPKPLLAPSPPFDITSASGKTHAIALLESLHREDHVLRAGAPPPKQIGVDARWGFRSEIEKILLRFFFSSSSTVQASLDDTISFVSNKFHCEQVVVVKADVTYQQALLSIAKISFLTGKHGVDRAAQLVMDDHAFEGALPSPLDMLGYVEPFLSFSPTVLAFPFRGFAFTAYFFGREPYGFSFPGISNVFEQWVSDAETYAPISVFDLLGSLALKRTQLRSYIDFVISGVNRLAAFLNDPRNFADPTTGEIDLLTQLQFYGGTWYCFSDFKLAATNHRSKTRISAAFKGFDKLANLRSKLNPAIGETDQWKGFFSAAQMTEMSSILRSGLQSYGDYLTNVVLRCARTHFDNLHQELSQTADLNDEAKRLTKIRAFRNLDHGTFLKAEQFETLFLSGSGKIDADVVGLFYFTILALICDPKRFLSFAPITAS